MKKILSSLLLAILVFTACTKHKDDVEDTSPKATILFESPMQGAFYNSGDSVLIKGTASYTTTIHGYDLVIHKATDTATLYFKHFHDHKAVVEINTKWKAESISNANLQAEVILYLDHEGHTGSKKVGFSIR
jgi:hypothetical protein